VHDRTTCILQTIRGILQVPSSVQGRVTVMHSFYCVCVYSYGPRGKSSPINNASQEFSA